MNLLIYLLLLGFTAVALPASQHLPVVMSLAAVKFLIVGMGFMGLRRAHWLWRAGFTAFAVLFLLLFTALS